MLTSVGGLHYQETQEGISEGVMYVYVCVCVCVCVCTCVHLESIYLLIYNLGHDKKKKKLQLSKKRFWLQDLGPLLSHMS